MKEEEPVLESSHPKMFDTPQKVVDHPSIFYSISEVYSIRKESINHSNDQIYKRLSKKFQMIKRLRC